MSWKGRRVLLTGASAGIGREIALQLAAGGARLVLAARDAEKLEEVAGRARSLGGEAHVVRADVGVEADCYALVEQALALSGGFDALLLNAGQDMWARLDEISDPSVFERLM